jgi:hypothetical protein
LVAVADAEPQLIVREYGNQKPILELPLNYGESFTMRYIHSVDGTPVFEVFRAVKREGLWLEETYFFMFGAGMGHWQGHGKIVQDGKWTKITEIHAPLGSFLLRVGSVGVDHTILLNGKEWNLSHTLAGRLVEVLLSEP